MLERYRTMKNSLFKRVAAAAAAVPLALTQCLTFTSAAAGNDAVQVVDNNVKGFEVKSDVSIESLLRIEPSETESAWNEKLNVALATAVGEGGYDLSEYPEKLTKNISGDYAKTVRTMLEEYVFDKPAKYVINKRRDTVLTISVSQINWNESLKYTPQDALEQLADHYNVPALKNVDFSSVVAAGDIEVTIGTSKLKDGTEIPVTVKFKPADGKALNAEEFMAYCKGKAEDLRKIGLAAIDKNFTGDLAVSKEKAQKQYSEKIDLIVEKFDRVQKNINDALAVEKKGPYDSIAEAADAANRFLSGKEIYTKKVNKKVPSSAADALKKDGVKDVLVKTLQVFTDKTNGGSINITPEQIGQFVDSIGSRYLTEADGTVRATDFSVVYDNKKATLVGAFDDAEKEEVKKYVEDKGYEYIGSYKKFTGTADFNGLNTFDVGDVDLKIERVLVTNTTTTAPAESTTTAADVTSTTSADAESTTTSADVTTTTSVIAESTTTSTDVTTSGKEDGTTATTTAATTTSGKEDETTATTTAATTTSGKEDGTTATTTAATTTSGKEDGTTATTTAATTTSGKEDGTTATTTAATTTSGKEDGSTTTTTEGTTTSDVTDDGSTTTTTEGTTTSTVTDDGSTTTTTEGTTTSDVTNDGSTTTTTTTGDESTTTTTTVTVPKDVTTSSVVESVYVEIETTHGFYLNTETSFDASQIKKATLYVVYGIGYMDGDKPVILSEYKDTIDVTGKVGFGNATPANTYKAVENKFDYDIQLTYEGETIKDKDGNQILAKGALMRDEASKIATALVYIGVKGDTNLDNIVDGRDATATLTYYAKSSTAKEGESFKLSPNEIVANAESELDDFAAFLTDVKWDADQKVERTAKKSDRVIDGRDATSILTFYSMASTEQYSAIASSDPEQIWSKAANNG
jgi:hypothetical protein